jgi:hypothetical protein
MVVWLTPARCQHAPRPLSLGRGAVGGGVAPSVEEVCANADEAARRSKKDIEMVTSRFRTIASFHRFRITLKAV